MTKRFLSILTAVLLLAALMIPAMASATETMYVYTQNGKGLHIRWEPSTNAEILTDAPFGTKITVKNHLGNGWTAIYWGGDDVFYVQSRFLVKNKPTKKPTAKTTTTKKTTSKEVPVAGTGTTAQELNKIFRTCKVVDVPYTVTVRDNPYSYTDENYAMLYLTSGGADNPGGYDFRESLLQRGIRVGVYGRENLTVTPGIHSLTGWTACSWGCAP